MQLIQPSVDNPVIYQAGFCIAWEWPDEGWEFTEISFNPFDVVYVRRLSAKALENKPRKSDGKIIEISKFVGKYPLSSIDLGHSDITIVGDAALIRDAVWNAKWACR